MGKKRHVDHVHQVGPVEDTHEADVLERVHRGYTSPKNKNKITFSSNDGQNTENICLSTTLGTAVSTTPMSTVSTI